MNRAEICCLRSYPRVTSTAPVVLKSGRLPPIPPSCPRPPAKSDPLPTSTPASRKWNEALK